jgi:nitrate reductase NapAB chaperone NapD
VTKNSNEVFLKSSNQYQYYKKKLRSIARSLSEFESIEVAVTSLKGKKIIILTIEQQLSTQKNI